MAEWVRGAGWRACDCPPLDGSASAAAPQVVVLDLADPRHTGAAQVAAVRRAFPGTRILAISGRFANALSAAAGSAMALGADSLLAKPFGASAFLEALRSALA